ncbi:CoB--CoM heterodisulfide reductase subunit C [Methanocaldococcus indicus]|uniref:CoB--CoM heterodisulfide reductase subunit C n=1 Tax=Methanocaldococcus indicus TaxID=213231 RepID=UPI003C6D0E95
MVLTNKDMSVDFINEIIETGKEILDEHHVASFKACYQCGTCTGACPSGRVTSYRTRRLMRFAQCGMRKFVIDSDDLWLCTTCYECYEKCPREVKITDIIKVMRNIAAREGKMALAHRKTALYVFKTGHAVPINDQIREVRKKLGLSEIPPTTHKYPDVLKIMQEIMRDLGFCDMVGICYETGKLEEPKWKDMSE